MNSIKDQNKKYDIVSLGELLVDFTQNGTSLQGNNLFEANPAGAPCNVLSIASKYGHSTAFIGKVGDDTFGHMLEDTIKSCGIDAAGLVFDKDVHTTLVLVNIDSDGERDFSFYRNPGADMMLCPEDIDSSIVSDCRIFEFGSLSLTHENNQHATWEAINHAKSNGAVIAFDPNLREMLWDDLQEAKVQIEKGLCFADVLKISDNEITWLTGCDDYDDGVAWIMEKNPKIKIIFVTLGREGSIAYYGDKKVFVKAFIQENTIDATGAGDTFFGSVLHFILENGLVELSEDQLTEMLTYANAAAALITTRYGALKVMPEMDEIKRVVENRG